MKELKYTKEMQRHGKTGNRIYRIYRGMKSRCFCKSDYHYKWYGAKGITICQEWLDDFMSFYNWSLENGYKDNLSIDRIDVNGNYEPSNCRWIDHKTQCNNRHNSHYIEINGEVKTMAQWLEIYADNNVSSASVRRRIKKGITGEALFAPLKIKRVHHKIVQKTLDGKIVRVFNQLEDVKKFGYTMQSIASVCKHKKYCHTAYGFLWEYED